MTKKRLALILLLLIWTGFVLSAFYVVQKPSIMHIASGLLSIIRTLVLTCLLLVDVACLGEWILRKLLPSSDSGERFFLGTGLGLGCLGLLGFGLAVSGVAQTIIMITILLSFAILAFKKGILHRVFDNLSEISKTIQAAPQRSLRWVPWMASINFIFTFLLAFAPPSDAFDALLYHLVVPDSWLKEGGLVSSTINPAYWFPTLVEGIYTWSLALYSETMTSLIHLAFACLTLGLIWYWAKEFKGITIAWRSIAIILTMPSLPLLASWAYTDLALAFFCTAALFTMWKSLETSNRNFWVLSAVFSGMAMGVKYTSFILPLVLVVWLGWQNRKQVKKLITNFLLFSLTAGLVSSPWYLRNWIWTGNPFYPFLFGGKFWDSFLATQYTNAGTGIGFNIARLFLLPLDMTLGYRDATYFDGRIGPWWLVLLPISIWILWKIQKQSFRAAIYLPAIFGFFSMVGWVFGVINTSSIWQTRLLFPALLPLAPLAAMAWDSFSELDSPRLRISFIMSSLIFLSVVLTTFDFGLFFISRNPIPYALENQDRQTYIKQVQPSFADALSLVSQTQPDANIYFLYEPRSYGMNRKINPDVLNTNLTHDFYLYQTPYNILQAWKSLGYTHVLYQIIGEKFFENPTETHKLFNLLDLVAETSNTRLYKIPSP